MHYLIIFFQNHFLPKIIFGCCENLTNRGPLFTCLVSLMIYCSLFLSLIYFRYLNPYHQTITFDHVLNLWNTLTSALNKEEGITNLETKNSIFILLIFTWVITIYSYLITSMIIRNTWHSYKHFMQLCQFVLEEHIYFLWK